MFKPLNGLDGGDELATNTTLCEYAEWNLFAGIVSLHCLEETNPPFLEQIVTRGIPLKKAARLSGNHPGIT